MKLEKQDRRSRRTRHLVQSALMELLLEKRYEAITVRDILDRAGIGSSTFYAHYFDKEDVQTVLIEQMLGQLSKPISQNTARPGLLPSLALFRHIQEHSQHFQALVRGYAEERSPSVPLAVVAQYLAGAFLSLLKWWIETEMPSSPERMDEIFQQLALPGVWTTIEGKSE